MSDGERHSFLESADARDVFSEEERRAIFDVIALRRDVRHFQAGRPIAPDVLTRILEAAHRAPSVGLSQPWGFVLVREDEQRRRIRENFLRCREAEAARFSAERRERYLALRLEGIVESALNVCVVVDFRSTEEAILGTTVQPEAVRASAICAVQNLWLAARAEGIGVGWVSIVEPRILRHELGLPPGVEPLAYLCVGHPLAFRSKPMLEETGWRHRRALDDVLHPDGRWDDGLARRTSEVSSTSARPPSGTSSRDASGASTSAFPRPSAHHERLARSRQAELTKPPGSLGRLEELAIAYAAMRASTTPPNALACALSVFAADHGVVAESVSAYGSRLTEALVCNVLAGGAAISVLAAEHLVDLTVVDVGVAGPLDAVPRDALHSLVRAKVRAGTDNIATHDAMTEDEVRTCLDVGRRVAVELVERGFELVGIGEIGIGNTTAGAAMISAFTGLPPDAVVGTGTGIDEPTRRRKVRVVERALARLGDERDPLRIASTVGGLELVAQAGYILACARARVPVVLDGYLSCASALLARALEPSVVSFLIASHLPAEKGGADALHALGLRPLLDLGLRLGEGTAAILGMSLVRSAVALQSKMATFATAGVVRPSQT